MEFKNATFKHWCKIEMQTEPFKLEFVSRAFKCACIGLMFAWDAKVYTSIIEVLADRKNRGALFLRMLQLRNQ